MPLDNLTLHQLRLIDTLARTGNLSEAAEEIGLSQSAASHALARLRKELGDPLFLRTHDGMQPTVYGVQLATSVQKALEALRAGLNKYSKFSPSDSDRTFNVIMSDVSQMLYLPKLLHRLSSEGPDITLCVHPLPSHSAHVPLESGAVDLAVGAYSKLIVGCRQRRLYQEEYVCVVRQEHPEFRSGMTLEAFCRVKQAIVHPRGYVHEQLDRQLKKHKAPRTARLYVPHFLSLPLVITQSDLLVVMAGRVAQMYAKFLPIKVMSPPVKLSNYNVMVFWHERAHKDPANRWLRNVYFELFGD